MKLWSENLGGNLHEATSILNKLGISDVVAMDCIGGYSTLVIYRITDEEYVQKIIAREQHNNIFKEQQNERRNQEAQEGH